MEPEHPKSHCWIGSDLTKYNTDSDDVIFTRRQHAWLLDIYRGMMNHAPDNVSHNSLYLSPPPFVVSLVLNVSPLPMAP